MSYIELRTSITKVLGSTMKSSLSPARPTGRTDWHDLTKREYVAIEAMSALIKVYGSKGEGHHKGPTKMKNLAYEYADKMLNHEPPLAE
jgi:hypothetical protein